MKKREVFKVEGDKIVRLRRNCPKCGDGVFLAEHKDRLSCGKCGYTEFKGKSSPPPTKEEEKPKEPEVTRPQEAQPQPEQEGEQESSEPPKEDEAAPPEDKPSE